MSLSRVRRNELNTKLHMDRQPTVARITDPSLPAGKRREIDNVMKKARANTTNDYWDKKLLEVEEKDPNRWRHTGYKKMYIQGQSSSDESEREVGYNNRAVHPPPARYGRSRSPRSRSRSPRSCSRDRSRIPPSPQVRRRSPLPPPMDGIRRHMPSGLGMRPRSPPEPPLRRKPAPRHRSPPPQQASSSQQIVQSRGQILPRSKRPPSPPPRNSCRSRTNSSVSSCSDDSCSVCSPKHSRRSRSNSLPRGRGNRAPRSPPPKPRRAHPPQYRSGPPTATATVSRVHAHDTDLVRGSEKYREQKIRHPSRERTPDRISSDGHVKTSRSGRHSPPPEDPRLKNRPPEPPEPHASSSSSTAVVVPAKKKKKDKEAKKLRTRIKIEGEKRKKHNTSSESDDSAASDSDSSLPTFTATTRLTLSERFGKMAQWSLDRSNMENMRITKDSVGGALKVMIEEGLQTPPPSRRYSYSPAPAGHFPEELATTAPSGMTMSWDDVRVRYDYYKSRGYLRDLDLKDYIKWEEWWYKYQEWLKQERYYEYWERQQLQRRRRKKLPITQRLN